MVGVALAEVRESFARGQCLVSVGREAPEESDGCYNSGVVRDTGYKDVCKWLERFEGTTANVAVVFVFERKVEVKVMHCFRVRGTGVLIASSGGPTAAQETRRARGRLKWLLACRVAARGGSRVYKR